MSLARRLRTPVSLAFILLATACGTSIDGDQWAAVTVTNTTSAPVVLDTHPARQLAPGQATVLHVDSNNDPQAVRVRTVADRVLGCLTFAFHTTTPTDISASVSDVAPCQNGIRSFPG
jgi:hypothetical protein